MSAISQEMLQISIIDMTLKMTNLKLQQHFPGAMRLSAHKSITLLFLLCNPADKHFLHDITCSITEHYTEQCFSFTGELWGIYCEDFGEN